MSRRRLESSLASAGILLGAAAWLFAACSSSKGSSAVLPDAAVPLCPTTPEATIGASCSTEGLACGPTFSCGVDTFSLGCVCRSGAFQCTDSSGNEVTAPPSCPKTVDASSFCPATEARAIGAPCTEVGLPCAYPSTCPGRIDTCSCLAGVLLDGGYGVRFDCVQVNCDSSDGAVISFADAAEDAPSDGFGGAISDSARTDADAAAVDGGALVDSAVDSSSSVPEAASAADGAGE